MRKLALFIITALIWHLEMSGQPDSTRVSFVNFYPGPDFYELEGHSALRISNGATDVAISYGTFDFDTPNFAYRFTKGETDYWVTSHPWSLFENLYRRQGRRIVEHEIRLDSLQTQRLLQLLQANFLPQNRTYRYNYVKDNCSLRPLRLLQKAIGDSIMLPEPSIEPQLTTFREAMRHYHKNYPWYQFGIDLALGSGIDYPIDSWEKAFAPVLLDTQLDKATVNGEPLVTATRVLNEGHDVTLAPTPWFITPLFVSWLVFVITLAVNLRDWQRGKLTRWYYASLYAIFGIAGMVLAFLVFISTHEATSPNWLLLWLNPFCLIIPMFIWLKKCNKLIISYQIINFALLLIMSIAWPWTGQSGNAAFVPLILCDMACAVVMIKTLKA